VESGCCLTAGGGERHAQRTPVTWHGRAPDKAAPFSLVHHRGRNSGREYVNPMMYLPDDSGHDTVYVFASKAGAPSHPGFADYARQTAGIRTIPVLELRRS